MLGCDDEPGDTGSPPAADTDADSLQFQRGIAPSVMQEVVLMVWFASKQRPSFSCRPRSGYASIAGLVLVSGCVESGDTGRPAEPLVVMTFNVLCSFCNTSEYDPWESRLESFDDIFQRHDPDLLGLQELAFESEVQDLLGLLDGFEARAYDLGEDIADPDATILFRADRFEVLEEGYYWLSPTPEEPYSTGFTDEGGVLPRLVAWTRLADAAGDRQLYFANTHFENTPPSQELSAQLVIERTASMATELPVLLTGDLNSQPSDEAYQILQAELDDGYDLATERVEYSNQQPAPSYDASQRIDHVFVGGAAQWSVERWTVDLSVYGDSDLPPSDHEPIVVEMAWE